MNDNTLMPFGKHKGIKLANVPPDYLIWLYENANRLQHDLKLYIEDNLDVLRIEVKRNKS